MVLPFLVLTGILAALPLQTEGMDTPALRVTQERLGIPENLARVTDVCWLSAQAPPNFILIQDVHRYPEVQSRIASLIVHGYEKWGVKKVFVEGAFTPLDLTVFHRIPSKMRSFLMERLLKEGELSGPEMAAVLIMEREWRDPPVSPFQTFGMENPQLYRENFIAYRSVLAQRERALEAVLSIRRLHASMNFSEGNPMTDQLNRVEALVRLRLTPAEYEMYLKTKAQTPSSPELTPAVKAAEEFYQVVQMRSRVFLAEATRKVPASDAPRIIVVGGFHTAAMADLLRQANISFVILSPVVSSVGNEEPIYEQRLRHTASLLAQAVVPASR